MMIRCGRCKRELPEDPNQLEEIVSCKYCDELFCSTTCADEHEEAVHPSEAAPVPDEEERRRREA